MLSRLLLLFILVPLVELALLIKIGSRIGVAETIALIIAAGLLGAWLVKREGLRTLTQMRTKLAAGHLPTDHLLDALLIFIAGVLLVTPGVLTDLLAIFLLLPPTRASLRRLLKNRIRARFAIFPHRPRADDDFIDVEPEPGPKKDRDQRRLED